MASHVKLLAEYSNPIDQVRHEAKLAACREARFQLQRLAAIDMTQEPDEFKALARNWRQQLQAVLGKRRA